MDPGKCARSACRRSLIDFDGGAYEDLIGSGIPFVGALHTYNEAGLRGWQ